MRVFNPIDGSELAAIIIATLKKALDEDENYRKHLTYPLIEFEIRVTVKGYPDIAFETGADGSAKLKQDTPAVVTVTCGQQIQAPVAGLAPDVARTEAGLPVLERTDTGAGFADVPVVRPSALSRLLQDSSKAKR